MHVTNWGGDTGDYGVVERQLIEQLQRINVRIQPHERYVDQHGDDTNGSCASLQRTSPMGCSMCTRQQIYEKDTIFGIHTVISVQCYVCGKEGISNDREETGLGNPSNQ